MPRTVQTRGAVQVTVDTRGIDYIRRALVRGSPRMRRGLFDSCLIIFGFWHQRFLTFGGGTWAPLEKSTQEKKRAAGYSPSLILRATDQLAIALNPALRNANVPGRRLFVSAKRLRANCGYGGAAVYRPGDDNYAKRLAFGNGSIATLAEIHQTAAYRRGKRRVIIVPPDRSTSRRVERRLQRAFNEEVGIANTKS